MGDKEKVRLIDANAIKYGRTTECLGHGLYIETQKVTKKYIESLPTVDAVEVVHGQWEDRENPQWKAYNIRHCSVCGWSIPKTKLRKKDSHWNYCPNCGAKMDGGMANE